MKSFAILPTLCFGLMLSMANATFAAGTYSESLTAADAALTAAQPDTALQELETALRQATNDGERALALAKKGYVLAYSKQDYAGARAAVDEALEVESLAPVAKVTALQVLAKCQTETDKDYYSAMNNLQNAMALEGVDWARPALSLALGDCYRSMGELDQALDAYQDVVDMPSADAGLKAGAYLNIGFIYQYDRKDAAKTKEAYAEAVKLRPDLQAEVDEHLGRLSSP